MTIEQWIKEKRKEAQELYDEAEEARSESEYTDFDALDQSTYNNGVLATLDELEEFIKSQQK